MSLCRFFGVALTLLLLGAFCGGAEAQTTPLVTASFATGLNHPSGWGTIAQTAIDSYGDWLVVDFSNGALYEFPHNGGALVTLIAPGGVGGGNNPGVAIDPDNNLYLGGNWNNCLVEYPYNAATQTWTGLSGLSSGNNTSDECGVAPEGFAQYSIFGFSPYYFQPWGIAIGNNDNMIVGNQNSGNFIFNLYVSGAWSSPSVPQNSSSTSDIISAMTKPPISVAQDKFGNVYFVEASGGLSGVYEIPASVVAAGTAGALTSDSGLTRIDPNLPSVSGVIVDPNGNLYVSDSQDGVFLIPNPSGTPETASAVMLTPVPAQGEVAIDWTRNILYVPTTQAQSNGQADVAKVTLDAADFGSASVADVTPAPSPVQEAVLFSFNGSVTPASFKIVEAGDANPDFVASGGTCAAGTSYAAQNSCTVNVSFAPHSAGSISAKLLMLDSSGNILAAMPLHGTGTSAAVQIQGGTQSAIGAGLNTPGQVAVDAADNVYVADSGLKAVEVYPAGSGASAATATVGTGLTAPTGVAVDGAGDVFIADSGSVYEVPEGSNGLNAAGQVTLINTGLGSNLRLAVSGRDRLYISDPDNHRVVELTNLGGTVGPLAQTETDLTGFNAPSAVAVDESGDLFVADGANLDEIPVGGTMTTLLTSLSTPAGLAVDPSGAVYVAETGGTIRIPNENGTLNAADETAIAASVTMPTSVALDSLGEVYITDGSALNVNLTSVSTSYNFGTLSTTTSTQSQTFTLVNDGNTALNVTGFSSTPDYSETATTCTGSPVAAGATCTATITFSPGPGDEGTLTGTVLVQGNVANSPVGVSGTGVGAALAPSITAITSGGAATTDNVPVNVGVVAASATSASPAATGMVTLTVSGNGITPITMTGPLSGGVAQFSPQNLVVGSYTFTASYTGDRNYLGSNTSTIVTVGAGPVTLTQPTATEIEASVPSFQMPQAYQASFGSGTGYLVLCTNPATGCDGVYDGSDTTWVYSYPVTVTAANGSPVTCVPVYSATGVLERQNCGSVSYKLSGGYINTPSSGNCAAGTAETTNQVDVSNVNGSALLATNCLQINNSNTTIPDLMTFYTITPVYNGTDFEGDPANPNYSSVTGTPINFWALRNPMVQISSSPTSLTVAAGSSVQATLTLTSVLGYGYAERGGTLNNYSLPLDLQCDGLPAYATCTFTYSAPIASDPNPNGVMCAPGSAAQYCAVNVGPTPGITLSNGSACTASEGCIGPGTVTMTINTNVSTATESSSLRADPGSFAFAAMFGLGLLGLTFRRKAQRWRGFQLLVCLLLCGGGVFGITACGTTNLSPSSATITPAGTYNVTVTAKETGTIQVQVPGAAAGVTETVYGNANQMSLPYTISVTFSK